MNCCSCLARVTSERSRTSEYSMIFRGVRIVIHFKKEDAGASLAGIGVDARDWKNDRSAVGARGKKAWWNCQAFIGCD